MSDKQIVIRDFIYVDADRLYSLYSQVFEGVANSIIESYLAGNTALEEQKGKPFHGSSHSEQLVETSQRTENKSLYDHMYNRLEDRLNSQITDASVVNHDNYKEVLENAVMIKITGTAEIENYQRLTVFLQRFNELGNAIGYSQILALKQEVEKAWKERQAVIEKVNDRNQKRIAMSKLQQDKEEFEKSVTEFLEKQGLRQDEQLMANLRLLIEIFYPDGFEITIKPSCESNIIYRGVLEQNWLRVSPYFLKSLYGTSVSAKWTMVGKVTYIPNWIAKNSADEEANNHDEKIADIQEIMSHANVATPEGAIDALEWTEENRKMWVNANEAVSMRDAYRKMFKAAQALENIFLESKERIEIVVYPLAIYHEVRFTEDLTDG